MCFLVIIKPVIGLLTVCFGCTYLSKGGIVAAHGIVGGVVICVVGFLGVSSLKDPKDHCKNGVYMGFLIVACWVSAIGICIYSVFLP